MVVYKREAPVFVVMMWWPGVDADSSRGLFFVDAALVPVVVALIERVVMVPLPLFCFWYSYL